MVIIKCMILKWNHAPSCYYSHHNNILARGIDTYFRGIDTYLRGIDTYLRGIDTYLRGIDTYFRGSFAH